MQIDFSNIEQAKAVRDVIEHRVHSVANNISLIGKPIVPNWDSSLHWSWQ